MSDQPKSEKETTKAEFEVKELDDELDDVAGGSCGGCDSCSGCSGTGCTGCGKVMHQI